MCVQVWDSETQTLDASKYNWNNWQICPVPPIILLFGLKNYQDQLYHKTITDFVSNFLKIKQVYN